MVSFVADPPSVTERVVGTLRAVKLSRPSLHVSAPAEGTTERRSPQTTGDTFYGQLCLCLELVKHDYVMFFSVILAEPELTEESPESRDPKGLDKKGISVDKITCALK